MDIRKFFRILTVSAAIAAVVGVIWYLGASNKEKAEYVTVKAARGRLVQTVSDTGTVKAAEDIDLSFLNSGKIAEISVREGDKVESGQILAELDYGVLSIKEKEARARLNKLTAGAAQEEIAVERANVNHAYAAYLSAKNELEKIKNTVAENIAQARKTVNDLESDSPRDVTVYEQAVESARINLDNTEKIYSQSVANKENDILTAIESGLADANTALDKINTILTDDDAKDVLSIKNTSYLASVKSSRSEAMELLSAANNSLAAAKANKTENNIRRAADDAKAVLDKTFESLNFCFDALGSTVTGSDFTQAELDAFKSDINAELTVISASISAAQTAEQNLADARLAYDTNVSNAEEKLAKARVDLDNAIINARNTLKSAEISGDRQITVAEANVKTAKELWEVAKARLAQIEAPARKEDIILARAALDSVKKQIEDSVIRAPVGGVITKVNYEVGERISPGKPVFSMVGANNFEVEVDVSESDIVKVNIGNPVEITLDAFGDDVVFPGKVYFIEPAETVIQDVIYYKVKIEFANNAKERQEALKNIKPGMTANVVITTARKDNVLIMPSRAIVRKNGRKYARILSGGRVTEKPVKIGLRGDEGMVEVLSGVKEGDEVVTFVKNKK